jgi:hypothetical protein
MLYNAVYVQCFVIGDLNLFDKTLKGQSHKKVHGFWVGGVRLGPNSYWFLNISDQHFNSYNCLKIIVGLIKPFPI